jgi:hypothetical protein
MLFCDENGEMIRENTVDLVSLGKTMNDVGILVSQPISDNMHCLLEAFGDIISEEKMIKVVVKEEEDPKKKALALKKTENEPPKLVDVMQKLTCYSEFEKALKTMKDFDLALTKLGYLKSPRLQAEVNELQEK